MDQELNWAALAIPVFLIATLGEGWIARKRGESVYAFGTAIADLTCGSTYQAMELVFKLATLGAYAFVFEHWRLITFDDGSAWPWIIGIVGVDILFYWWHRISHVVNCMWAVHGVHHQSEDYNLAVALRQPIFEPISWFFFYVPLAFLGVSPLVYLAAYGLNRFYQFWIHTELVDKWPRPLEWLLNTPSHHRVHHGVDEVYLDKNYGAILIVWDRLFRSFEPERQHPTYGTTIPLRSYNPMWSNFEHIHRMWTLCRLASRWQDKLHVWFAHPAWLPAGVTDPAMKPDRTRYAKYRLPVPGSLQAYVIVHFAIAGTMMGLVMFFEHWLTVPQLVGASTVLVASFTAFGGLIEHRWWAVPLEFVRLAGLVAVIAWLLGGATSIGWLPVVAIVLGVALLCAIMVPLLRVQPVPPPGHL